jgi:hypothetical protein
MVLGDSPFASSRRQIGAWTISEWGAPVFLHFSIAIHCVFVHDATMRT